MQCSKSAVKRSSFSLIRNLRHSNMGFTVETSKNAAIRKLLRERRGMVSGVRGWSSQSAVLAKLVQEAGKIRVTGEGETGDLRVIENPAAKLPPGFESRTDCLLPHQNRDVPCQGHFLDITSQRFVEVVIQAHGFRFPRGTVDRSYFSSVRISKCNRANRIWKSGVLNLLSARDSSIDIRVERGAQSDSSSAYCCGVAP